MNDNKTFRENLNKLIELFKKVKKRSEDDEYGGQEKSFLFNFDMILRNYEMLKNNLPDEILDQIGEPFRQVVADMIDQLQTELDQETDLKPSTPILEEHFKNMDVGEELKRIDEILSKSGLSYGQIDELLDKRAELLKKKDEE